MNLNQNELTTVTMKRVHMSRSMANKDYPANVSTYFVQSVYSKRSLLECAQQCLQTSGCSWLKFSNMKCYLMHRRVCIAMSMWIYSTESNLFTTSKLAYFLTLYLSKATVV